MPVFGKEIVKELNRPLIKDMTSAELYALDFAKMEPGERAAFRDELHEKPGHGPLAPAAEHRIYAEAHARWSDWVKDHPEDDVKNSADPARLGQAGTAREAPRSPTALLERPEQVDASQDQPKPSVTPTPSQPRPDGTAPRRPKETGL